MTTTRGFTFFYDPPRRRRASRVQRGLLVQCLGFKIAHVGYREVGAVAARAETSVSPLGVFKSSEFVTTATDENAIAAPAAAGLRLMPYSGSNTPAATGTPTRLYARAHPRFCRILPSALRPSSIASAAWPTPPPGDSYFPPPWPSPRAPRRRGGGRLHAPADRHPDVRRDERRRVVDSVAHHGDARAVRLGPEALDERRLVVGEQPADGDGAAAGQPSSRATASTAAAGRRRARTPACPSPAAGARMPRHPADPIRERERADHALALDAHAHQTARGGGGAARASEPPPRSSAAAVPPPRPPRFHPRGLTHEHVLASTRQRRAQGRSRRSSREASSPPRRGRRRGRGERVRGGGLDGGGEAKHVGVDGVPGGRHTRDPRLALRDGPRLVQRDDADVRGRLEHVAAAQQQPAPRARGRRDEHGGGRRQPERAGTPRRARRWRASARRGSRPRRWTLGEARPGTRRRRAGTRTRTSMPRRSSPRKRRPGDGVRQAPYGAARFARRRRHARFRRRRSRRQSRWRAR